MALQGTLMLNCRNCNKEMQYKRMNRNIYCSNSCQKEYEYKNYIAEWLEGKQSGTIGKLNALSRHLKKYVLLKYNNSCAQCGINSWNNKPIVLEVEHIDGNGNNNVENNLTLLCPNCHSQTATYKGANRGKGRKQRYK